MVQTVARVFGVVFLLVGVLGFLASGMSMESDPALAPRLLGLFPVNALHNVVHLLFGVWGLAASRTSSGAELYAKGAGAIYLVLAVLGYVAPTTFGLIPIGGHDIWLHAVLGVVLLGTGFLAPKTATI
jgi:hypothetical protein